MRRGVFRALIALGVLAPVGACAAAFSSPRVRDAVHAFTQPLAVASTGSVGALDAGGGVSLLPTTIGPAGVESIELGAIRLAAADAGAVVAAHVPALAPPPPVPSGATPPKHASGLTRSPLAARDDVAIDRVVDGFTGVAAPRASLQAAIGKLGSHRAELERVLRAWKMPEALVALAVVESAGDATRVSAGTAGLWGLGTDVASGYHLSVLPTYDERRGISLSSECAAHYASDLYDRFGTWEMAIFAYGMGYSEALAATAHAREKAGSAPAPASADFWAQAPDLPAAGVAYVAEVLAVATVLANVDRLRFQIHSDDPVLTSDLEVPSGAPFSAIAYAAGTPVDRLHLLNPEYLSETVPTTGFAMMVHVPSEGLARAKEMLLPLLYGGSVPNGHAPILDAGILDGAAPASNAVALDDQATVVGSGEQRHVFYRVNDGDTLDAIGRKFGVLPATIASDNVIDPSSGLKAGQLLTVRIEGGDVDAGSPKAPQSDTPHRHKHH